MQQERVVELTFGTLSSGSGYLITPRHVLTARHVVKPRQKGSGCTIAPLGKPGAQPPPPAAGKAVWISDREEQDFAIIEADDAGWPLVANGRIAFGRVDWADPADRRKFQAIGFPEAAGASDHPIEGKLTWVTRGGGCLNLDVTSSVPRKPGWWAGFSGATAFSNGLAVGVVREVVPNFDGLLTATPLEYLLKDNGFQAYWTAQGLTLPEERVVTGFGTTILDQIKARAFLIDRGEASAEIIKHLASLPSRSAPQVILVPGLDDDDHRYLIQQLSARREVQRFLDREAAVQDMILKLPWPEESPEIDPDVEFRQVIEALYKFARLEPPPPGQPPDVERLRAAFDDGATPRAFWVLGRRAVAFAGHGELLSRLLDLWHGLPAGHPVILFLCLAFDDPPKPRRNPLARFGFPTRQRKPDPRWHRVVEDAAQARQGIVLDPLSTITLSHVDPWIDKLRRECLSAPPEHFDGLRAGLLSRIRDEKRLRRVVIDLDDLLGNA